MTATVRPGRTFARWLAPAACRMSPDRYRSAPPALTVAEPRRYDIYFTGIGGTGVGQSPSRHV
jgi:hypothetical protein